ncbi:FIST signal transduction protein [Candidatus Nitronereus thalassa]|uniref:FIST N-terminal domain-containing protein n=1 Tax=Candidatus Nitronereus thalassa TaxID=3020898 RepID=A0ABU3K7S7_9BACT|nr:FIST N-terminal domain-containing protein [Candidatus Nitronereus thalassa]MDT7042451.1 FIST N-terminal domain-containing protein [Candidatus Nitronereus thalassa]
MKVHVAVSRKSEIDDVVSDLSQSIKDALGTEKVDLMFVFFSIHYGDEDRAEALVRQLWETVDPEVMLGCMGEGIISPTEEYEGNSVVSVWVANLPNVRMLPMHLQFNEDEGTHTTEGWPVALQSTTERPTFLLFADPFSTPIESVFSDIEESCPGASAIGGVASGGSDLGENRMVYNGRIVTEGMTGVALWGPVSVRTLVSQGCKPIGERFVVTKAERNIIYELGGAPTLQRLQATLDKLGINGGRQAARALQIGIAFDEHRERLDQGDFLIRGIIGADQSSGGLAISDLIEEGQTVQFHLRDAKAASEELNLMLAKDQVEFPNKTPKGALLFTCNGRGRQFFAEPHHDVRAIQKRAEGLPIAGFFAAGEIGPVGGKNFIHGYTASVALFAEK